MLLICTFMRSGLYIHNMLTSLTIDLCYEGSALLKCFISIIFGILWKLVTWSLGSRWSLKSRQPIRARRPRLSGRITRFSSFTFASPWSLWSLLTPQNLCGSEKQLYQWQSLFKVMSKLSSNVIWLSFWYLHHSFPHKKGTQWPQAV